MPGAPDAGGGGADFSLASMMRHRRVPPTLKTALAPPKQVCSIPDNRNRKAAGMILSQAKSNKVPLRNLNFGAPDAQSEKNFVSERYFLNAFFLPEDIEISDFLSRRTFFVLGLKGAGKTALLQYIASRLDPNTAEAVSIIFKHDVDEEEKQRLQRLSNTVVQSDNQDAAHSDDYENAWFWYFHQKIVQQITRKQSELYERNESFDRYTQVIKGSSAPGESGITSLANAAKDGAIRFAFDLKLLKLEGGINFEKVNTDKKTIALSWFVKAANQMLQDLAPRGKKELFIFVDEINLSYGSRAQYARDCVLVRDLISSVYQMNSLFAQKSIPIKVICAIRSEVLSATAIAGKEVNKYTNSCGMTLSWHRRVSDSDQPLHRVIEGKIRASEEEFFGKRSSANIWDTYFAPRASEVPMKEYILHQTWFTPRDLVVLLDLAKQADRDAQVFDEEAFTACRKTYAESSWIEKIEALQANYNTHQIEAIRRILQGVSGRTFTLDAFAAESASLGNSNQQVKRLVAERDITLILEDLYRIGVIGNLIKNGGKPRFRWMFRGDADLNPKQPITIHRALWAKFA